MTAKLEISGGKTSNPIMRITQRDRQYDEAQSSMFEKEKETQRESRKNKCFVILIYLNSNFLNYAAAAVVVDDTQLTTNAIESWCMHRHTQHTISLHGPVIFGQSDSFGLVSSTCRRNMLSQLSPRSTIYALFNPLFEFFSASTLSWVEWKKNGRSQLFNLIISFIFFLSLSLSHSTLSIFYFQLIHFIHFAFSILITLIDLQEAGTQGERWREREKRQNDKT